MVQKIHFRRYRSTRKNIGRMAQSFERHRAGGSLVTVLHLRFVPGCRVKHILFAITAAPLTTTVPAAKPEEAKE
jgi:hypothetical protein